MKRWTILVAAAALTIGAAAHAGELDDAALDSVTAGRWFSIEALTIPSIVRVLGASESASGSIEQSANAFGKRTVGPSGGSTIELRGEASGRSFASVPGWATASGGGAVYLSVR